MKQLLFTALFAALSFSIFAQPGEEEVIPAENDGVAQVQEMMALMAAYDRYNAEINRDMATGGLAQHRLTLNANSNAKPGVGEYNQSVQMYYSMQGASSILKKAIVVTARDGAQEYSELTFDDDGNLYIAKYNPNMLDPSGAGSQNFYYTKGEVTMYTVENALQMHDGENYDEAAFKASVEWLNEAEEFKVIFGAIMRIQPE